MKRLLNLLMLFAAMSFTAQAADVEFELDSLYKITPAGGECGGEIAIDNQTSSDIKRIEFRVIYSQDLWLYSSSNWHSAYPADDNAGDDGYWYAFYDDTSNVDQIVSKDIKFFTDDYNSVYVVPDQDEFLRLHFKAKSGVWDWGDTSQFHVKILKIVKKDGSEMDPPDGYLTSSIKFGDERQQNAYFRADYNLVNQKLTVNLDYKSDMEMTDGSFKLDLPQGVTNPSWRGLGAVDFSGTTEEWSGSAEAEDSWTDLGTITFDAAKRYGKDTLRLTDLSFMSGRTDLSEIPDNLTLIIDFGDKKSFYLKADYRLADDRLYVSLDYKADLETTSGSFALHLPDGVTNPEWQGLGRMNLASARKGWTGSAPATDTWQEFGVLSFDVAKRYGKDTLVFQDIRFYSGKIDMLEVPKNIYVEIDFGKAPPPPKPKLYIAIDTASLRGTPEDSMVFVDILARSEPGRLWDSARFELSFSDNLGLQSVYPHKGILTTRYLEQSKYSMLAKGFRLTDEFQKIWTVKLKVRYLAKDNWLKIIGPDNQDYFRIILDWPPPPPPTPDLKFAAESAYAVNIGMESAEIDVSVLNPKVKAEAIRFDLGYASPDRRDLGIHLNQYGPLGARLPDGSDAKGTWASSARLMHAEADSNLFSIAVEQLEVSSPFIMDDDWFKYLEMYFELRPNYYQAGTRLTFHLYNFEVKVDNKWIKLDDYKKVVITLEEEPPPPPVDSDIKLRIKSGFPVNTTTPDIRGDLWIWTEDDKRFIDSITFSVKYADNRIEFYDTGARLPSGQNADGRWSSIERRLKWNHWMVKLSPLSGAIITAEDFPYKFLELYFRNKGGFRPGDKVVIDIMDIKIYPSNDKVIDHPDLQLVIEFLKPTSVSEEGVSEDLKVYPNPATDIVEFNGLLQTEAQIMTLGGSTVMTIPPFSQNADVGRLPTGSYIIVIGNKTLPLTIIR